MLINLFYILLFAIATVIIYIWGMKRNKVRKRTVRYLYKKVKKIVIKNLFNKIRLYLEKI